MQTYIGTKMIKAQPMNRLDYNKYRGWELPADEDGSDPGYLVEYLDGGQANHPDHEGYISWSPANVFNRAYEPMDSVDGLPGFVQRLVIEKTQLDIKREALGNFKYTRAFEILPWQEQERLNTQAHIMTMYSAVLGDRLEFALSRL